jgi:hypothetical protein
MVDKKAPKIKQPYRLLESGHTESVFITKGDKKVRRTKTYAKGDVVWSTIDLVEEFPNKFELVVESKPLVQPIEDTLENTSSPASPVGPKGSEEEPGGQGHNEPKSPHGEDVTDEFPEAFEADYAVYVNDKNHYTLVEDNGKGAVKTEKPLTKAQLNKFITKLVGGDE